MRRRLLSACVVVTLLSATLVAAGDACEQTREQGYQQADADYSTCVSNWDWSDSCALTPTVIMVRTPASCQNDGGGSRS